MRRIDVNRGVGMGDLVLACIERPRVHRFLRADPEVQVAFAVGPILLALTAKILHDRILLKEANVHPYLDLKNQKRFDSKSNGSALTLRTCARSKFRFY